MIDYIKGEIIELSPAHAVLEAGGIGYHINIALSTYSELNGKSNTKLYVYEAIREDAHILFGFMTKEERSLFLLLISVSGVGANTARMILSSIMANELQNAIITGNVSILKSIKGIGAKTAERIIVDLKDKVFKVEFSAQGISAASTSISEEAVAALVMLGFTQAMAQKAVKKVMDSDPQQKIEQIVKQALKLL
jgi:holliday junction DNA helicase ruvA